MRREGNCPRRAGARIWRGAVITTSRQLRRLFSTSVLLLVERQQTYIGRALAREHGPRHEAVEHFALPLRKGVRAFSEEHELVLLGVVDGLAGVAEIGGDRGAVVAMLAWPCAVRVHCYPPHSPSSSANIELIS